MIKNIVCIGQLCVYIHGDGKTVYSINNKEYTESEIHALYNLCCDYHPELFIYPNNKEFFDSFESREQLALEISDSKDCSAHDMYCVRKEGHLKSGTLYECMSAKITNDIYYWIVKSECYYV